ncbi:hypothetical protein LTR94_032580, partial [Friedmanniomyces endolithicus]
MIRRVAAAFDEPFRSQVERGREVPFRASFIMFIKAFAYVRYSDPSQSTGNSVARQTEMAVAYAAKNGVELDWSYRDDGVSAFHGHNRTVGDLGRFMADVQSGKVVAGSHLLIEGFDRFSREDPFESLYTFLTILR